MRLFWVAAHHLYHHAGHILGIPHLGSETCYRLSQRARRA